MWASLFPLLELVLTIIGLNLGSIWREKNNNTLHIGKPIPQASLFAHFSQPDHNGFDDWLFVLIDQDFNDVQLKKKECFWQYKLDVFEPKGLNVREVQLTLD